MFGGLRLPLLSPYRAGDLGQTHLADVARRHTQGIQRFRGIEIHNTAKILIRKVGRRINSAACQQHIAHAVGQQRPIPYLQIQVIQLMAPASQIMDSPSSSEQITTGMLSP